MIGDIFIYIFYFVAHAIFVGGAVTLAIPGLALALADITLYIGRAMNSVPLVSMLTPYVYFVVGWKSTLFAFQGGRFIVNLVRGSGA